MAQKRLLPAGVTAWVLGSGAAGHEVQCVGVARALGLEPVIKAVRPRALFRALSPMGPVDFRDSPRRAGSLLAPPFPDIAIAAGRVTIPYLRALKRASGGAVFTVCLQDPRTGAGTADVIWVQEHDQLRGENVIVTLTAPHGVGGATLAAAREHPDPRIAALPEPRAAVILGGASAHHTFETRDIEALARIAGNIAASAGSVMVTPSRRTPAALLEAVRQSLAGAGGRAFVWDGTGVNPYAQMLAHAAALIVTADSANMMGEALATGVPVHVYEPSGGHPKMSAFLQRLIDEGFVRRWAGALESWSYAPVDATQEIAAAIATRFSAFRR